MLKVLRIKINRYRNVAPGTELRLDARVNLVLGESGSGKTMLLGLLAAIAGSDFSRLEDEPFDLVYDLGDGVFTATVAISADGPPPRSPLDGLPEPTVYSYQVSVHRDGGATVCEFAGTPEALTVRVSGVAEPRRLPPSAPFRRGFLTPALRQAPAAALFFGAWHLFNWHGTAARFDESLGCFLAMTGRSPTLQGVALPRPAEAVFSFDPRARDAHQHPVFGRTTICRSARSTARSSRPTATPRARPSSPPSPPWSTTTPTTRPRTPASTSCAAPPRCSASAAPRSTPTSRPTASSARPASSTTPSAASRSGSPAATTPRSTTIASATARSACSRCSTIWPHRRSS
jgi:hypothetical protein